jgi:hypothetical protein
LLEAGDRINFTKCLDVQIVNPNLPHLGPISETHYKNKNMLLKLLMCNQTVKDKRNVTETYTRNYVRNVWQDTAEWGKAEKLGGIWEWAEQNLATEDIYY